MFCPDCGAMLDGKPICPQCGLNVKGGGTTQSTTQKPAPQPDQTYAQPRRNQQNQPTPSTQQQGPNQQQRMPQQPQEQKKQKKKKKKKSKPLISEDQEVLFEPILKSIGPYLWIINIVFAFGPWIQEMVEYFSYKKDYDPIYDPILIDWLLWTSFGVIFAFAVSWFVFKPVGEKMKKGDWEEIINDYSRFGPFQAPQILFWSIIQAVVLSFWGSSLTLVVGLILCFFSKYKEDIEWKVPEI